MASTNSQTLEAMWDYLSTLSNTSDDDAVRKYLDFFTPTATVYLSGMSQPPATSHALLTTAIKTLLNYWSHLDRMVIHHVEGEDGSVVNGMENKILIAGEVVEGFKECEVVKFEDGRISEYLLYVDPAPIMAVFAKKAAEAKE
jgi:ketosteroid isomerase-like protein